MFFYMVRVYRANFLAQAIKLVKQDYAKNSAESMKIAAHSCAKMSKWIIRIWGTEQGTNKARYDQDIGYLMHNAWVPVSSSHCVWIDKLLAGYEIIAHHLA